MKDKNPIILKMSHISKEFPGVKALDDVSLEVRKGEVHCLMGENGAGKSTLIKVLTGVNRPESGSIMYLDKVVSPKSPLEAQHIGISTVYQEVNLCLNLSVAENIYIGREPMKHGKIDWDTMHQNADQLLGELNLKIDSRELLSKYSVAIQQMVAITRAVDISQGLLILDEPTSSLDNKEVDDLFKVINKLKESGLSIIFITHFINQVYEISDRITVLRNGCYVGTYETAHLSSMDLISKMIGKEVEEISRTTSNTPNQEVEQESLIRLNNFGKKGKIEDVDLHIYKGEVLGLAGLLGSGRTEIARLLFGIDKNDSGVMYIDNKMFRSMYPQKAISHGMGFCPEERKTEAIIGELSIRENIILALQARQGYLKYITRKKQEEITKKYIELLAIKTPSMEQRIDKLSGGNQQKVILARWLATNPRLLILDEPTRGIDIGSRTEIQKLIIKLAHEGMTILLISSELDEIVKCCNRVLVLRDRNIIGELKNQNISEEVIMQIIANAST